MDSLSSTDGVVAMAAAAVAVLALLLAAASLWRLRTVRNAQRAVLGEAGERDLVAHAARLEQGFVDLRDWVEETARGIDGRMATAERRLGGCVAYRAVVRYDAYGEMSGRQSSSVALLDSGRSGIVISSILHRETARVYVKQVTDGSSELELSPEEQEAVRSALDADHPAPAGG